MVRKHGKLQRAFLLFRIWGWNLTSRDNDPAQAKRSVQNNMADMNDLFFIGDDFDAVLGILENEERIKRRKK